MYINTPITNALEIADYKAQYDAQVKKILSNRQILAWILKYTTSEFQDYPIAEIAESIEGTPEVGTVPLYPGQSHDANIKGMPNEDNVPTEGKVMFDIRFYAMTREKERVKLIINVEAQKDYYPGYDLVTRGIFYCARMLSSQLDTEFQADRYDDMKKVYSIWICMNAPAYAADTITEYKMTPHDLAGNYSGKARYDLLSVVMVQLGKTEADGDTPKLQRLLYTLLSDEMHMEEKLERLDKEFEIETKQEVKGGTNLMCNLSDLIEEKGIAKGRAEAEEKGIRLLIGAYRKGGFSKDTICEELKEGYHLSTETASDYIEKYWQ